MPRIHCPTPLQTGAQLALPPAAARHVQVLRMQPGDSLTLFDGGLHAQPGGEYSATIVRMGRSDVLVDIGAHTPIEREAAQAVHLVLGMPANERMDWLVEKATELGVASIQPLVTERSVLRLAADRAMKKQAHWQSIAIAACEQCGRNRVPPVHAVQSLAQWLDQLSPPADVTEATDRCLLSLREGSRPLAERLRQRASGGSGGTGSANGAGQRFLVLSGPEGGLSPAEENAAVAKGFMPVSLGDRVLRAETAPLAVLAMVNLGTR